MVSEWPRRQAETRSALKKARPLEDKILASIEKRVSYIQELLTPAAENSSVSRNVTKEAEETAHAVAKVRIYGLSVDAAFTGIVCYMFWIFFFPRFCFLCVQESKDILSQAKHARTASAQLGSHIDSAVQRLDEQEMLTDAAMSQMTEVLDTATPPSYFPRAALKIATSCFAA